MAAAGVAALGLVAGLATWWLVTSGGGASEKDAAGTATRAGHSGRLGSRARPRAPHWLGQPGLEARRVAGRVVHQGSPVAGATVRLEATGRLRDAVPPAVLTSGPDGAFDFGPQPAIEIAVWASAPGRAPGGSVVDLRDPTAAPEPDRLELVLGECAQTVFGTVHDRGGPIAGAALRARTRAAGFALAVTGDDGGYQLCLGPGPASMEVEADGYARAEVTVKRARRSRRDVELSPEALLEGVVVGPDERPVDGALVTARLAEEITPFMASAHTAVTEGGGRFAMGRLAPGRYRLSARDRGRGTQDAVDAVAQVGGSEPVTLRLSPRIIVRGRVVEGEHPVAGARLAYRTGRWMRVNRSLVPSADAVSQRDGSFDIDAVPAGPFAVAVADFEVLEPTEATAAPPDTEVTVKVARKASIAGRVTREGKPVAGAEVLVWGDRRALAGAVLTRADGTYEFAGLDAGAHEVHAEGANAFARAKAITVAKGQRLDGVDIELDLAAEIAGVVVDQRGHPVGGVAVIFEMGPKVDWGFATTDDDGTFVAGAMSGGGSYAVTVKPDRSSPIELEPAPGTRFPTVPLADGRSRATDVRIAVQLDRKPIAGVVIGPDGTPAADVRVAAFAPLESPFLMRYMRPAAEVATGADGTFVLRDLVAGPYTVRARSASGVEVIADKVPAGRGDLRLVLPATGVIEASAGAADVTGP